MKLLSTMINASLYFRKIALPCAATMPRTGWLRTSTVLMVMTTTLEPKTDSNQIRVQVQHQRVVEPELWDGLAPGACDTATDAEQWGNRSSWYWYNLQIIRIRITTSALASMSVLTRTISSCSRAAPATTQRIWSGTWRCWQRSTRRWVRTRTHWSWVPATSWPPTVLTAGTTTWTRSCCPPWASSTTPATLSSWPWSSGSRGISYRIWWRRMSKSVPTPTNNNDHQQLSPAVTASLQSQLSVSVNQLVGLLSERITALEAGANR